MGIELVTMRSKAQCFYCLATKAQYYRSYSYSTVQRKVQNIRGYPRIYTQTSAGTSVLNTHVQYTQLAWSQPYVCGNYKKAVPPAGVESHVWSHA